VSGEGDIRPTGDAVNVPEAKARHRLLASRLIIFVAALGIAAPFGYLAIGYGLAWQSDRQHAAAQRTAVRAAVGEFRALFGNGHEVDPRFIRMIEQGAGLKDVRFGPAPAADAAEMQPVMNADGRIAGFLTWRPDAPMTAMMNRVAPLVGGLAFGLLALAGFSLRRLRPVLAQSERQSREAVERSPLAALPGDAKMPGRVDVSTPERGPEDEFVRRELPRALRAQALDLHYQPIVAADGGRAVGVEALLRWTHKDRGAVSPAQFVPVAERMGLMDELGAFVLRRALRDARSWPDLYISVNLSPLQVRDRGIVDLVRQALRDSGVAPSKLMLEITEGVLIENPEEMLKRIEELRALGVRIALDDFGAGYSSLGYLQRFPFDKLKVDRSFVAPLGRSPNAGVIIQAIVALGRALGVTVVVEGVETEEQRVLLRLAGCDEMQGFLFARPAPARAIDRLIAQSGKSVA
jgi:EAL domain-containing protein (putative c-di-GMP-specific phosphodiesterase class I)